VARLVRSPAKIGWPAFQALNVASAIPTQRRWTKTKLTIAARVTKIVMSTSCVLRRARCRRCQRHSRRAARPEAARAGRRARTRGRRRCARLLARRSRRYGRTPAASAGSRAASAHPLGDVPYGAWLGCRVPFPTGGRSTAGAPRRVHSISRPRGPEAGRS
jgi:hypothetical protein